MSVYTDDVDAAWAQAQEMGFEIVRPLTKETWGVRRFLAPRFIRVFLTFYSTVSDRYREAAQKRYRPALAKLLGDISSSMLNAGGDFVRKSGCIFAHRRDHLVEPWWAVTLSN